MQYLLMWNSEEKHKIENAPKPCVKHTHYSTLKTASYGKLFLITLTLFI